MCFERSASYSQKINDTKSDLIFCQKFLADIFREMATSQQYFERKSDQTYTGEKNHESLFTFLLSRADLYSI